MKKKNTLKFFFLFQETELSFISRVIKTDFLIFLVLKNKNSCFFPRWSPQQFSFFAFFSVSLFTFLGYFHYSPFSGVFIFHLSQVFLCCCTASATDLGELFLLSGVFYLTLLPIIWHNLHLSRLPWELVVLP